MSDEIIQVSFVEDPVNVSVVNPLAVEAWVEQVVSQGGSINVDTQMSDSSTNAVQNRVIKSYVDNATEDEIVYGTFTITGDTSVTASLTAAQIASNLILGKRIILRGTIDNETLDLPFIEEDSNGYTFGAGYAAMVGGVFYKVRLGKGLVVNSWNKESIGSTDDFLIGSESTTGELVLEDSNSNEWTVYTKDAMDTALGNKADTSDLATVATSGSYADLSNKPTIDSTPTSQSANAVSSGGVYTALQSYSKLEIEEESGTNYVLITDNGESPSTSYLLTHPTPKVTVSGASVTQALVVDKFYVFGEVSSLTITLSSYLADANVHEYHFRFTSGSTATTLSLPNSVTMPSGFQVEASKTYEISIVDNYGTYVAW